MNFGIIKSQFKRNRKVLQEVKDGLLNGILNRRTLLLILYFFLYLILSSFHSFTQIKNKNKGKPSVGILTKGCKKWKDRGKEVKNERLLHRNCHSNKEANMFDCNKKVNLCQLHDGNKVNSQFCRILMKNVENLLILS